MRGKAAKMAKVAISATFAAGYSCQLYRQGENGRGAARGKGAKGTKGATYATFFGLVITCLILPLRGKGRAPRVRQIAAL